MRIPRIYYAGELSVGIKIALDKSASQHLVRVLRLQPGAKLYVFNGQGGEYEATIVAINKGQAKLEVQALCTVDRESPLQIHLGQGISRGERMDYVIQKAVELGVTRITPLFTARCEVKLSGDRLHKRVAHWQAVAISACEQSGRCVVPTIVAPTPLAAWLQLPHAYGLVCDPQAQQSCAQQLTDQAAVSVLIGPEGGLTEQEIELSQQCAFQTVALGPRTLRTETAAVVALSLIQGIVGDLA